MLTQLSTYLLWTLPQNYLVGLHWWYFFTVCTVVQNRWYWPTLQWTSFS